MKFNVELATDIKGTYTGEGKTLTLDGYFNGKYDGKDVTYAVFDNTRNAILFFDDGTSLVVKLSDGGFTLSTAAETGSYNVGSSSSYSLYLDGEGNLIYYNGEYKYGTYEYTPSTGAFVVKNWNGSAAQASVDGYFNAETGAGYLAYYYYGDTFLPFGKTAFTQFLSSWGSLNNYKSVTLIAYTQTDDGVTTVETSLSVYLSGQTLFVAPYSKAYEVITLSKQLSEGESLTQSIEFTKFDPKGELTLTVTLKDGTYTFDFSPVYAKQEKVIVGDKTYVLNWLDEEQTLVGIYVLGESSSLTAGKAIWNTDKTSFSLESFNMESGEYAAIVVSGYGTENVSISAKTSEVIGYYSYSGAEYKYYKVNIYSEDQLWVSNSNIDGASPEVVTYTTTERDGVTYYTFTSGATGKVVTFHIVEGYYTEFVVDSEE
jgi:hypothetical protein